MKTPIQNAPSAYLCLCLVARGATALPLPSTCPWVELCECVFSCDFLNVFQIQIQSWLQRRRARCVITTSARITLVSLHIDRRANGH